MAKETKFGLAVIGVLLSVFGVLLFRHLSMSRPDSQGHESRAPVEPLSAGPATAKPNVVVAQKDSPGHGTSDSLWGPAPGQPSSSPDVPAASYMPADSETGAADDRYAADPPDLEPADTAAAPGPSPFRNRAPDRAPDPAAPAELPRQDSSGQARRNPLRRLSAELPLPAEETPEAEPGDALPDPSAPAAADDPYALDEQPAQPIDANAEPPADPDQAGPEGIGGAAADDQPDATPDPFPDAIPDAPARAPAAANIGRQPVAGARGREAIPDDWRGGEPTLGRNEPLPVENGMYTVQPNDTLWSISEKVYGTGGYFKAIAAHNRNNLPRSDQLSVGTRVAVPPLEELEQNYPSLCPKQRKSALVKPRGAAAAAPPRQLAGGEVYVVEQGDTLFDIARYELGKASRWAEIYELNRAQLGEDFDYLQPGIELRLPAKTDSAESIGRGGDPRYVR
jgi:nucleoid-associated protein YgaU